MEGGSNDGQRVQVMEEKNKEMQKQDRVIGPYLLNNYSLKNVNTGRKSGIWHYMQQYRIQERALRTIIQALAHPQQPSLQLLQAAALGVILSAM